MKPMFEALQAISRYLKEQGDFVVSWGGNIDEPRVNIGVTIRCDRYVGPSRGMLRLSWLDGELMLVNWAVIPPVSKQAALLVGAEFFDLADPSCFDQIADAARERDELDDDHGSD